MRPTPATTMATASTTAIKKKCANQYTNCEEVLISPAGVQEKARRINHACDVHRRQHCPKLQIGFVSLHFQNLE